MANVKQKPSILVTGFGPFGTHEINPSQLIVDKLKSSDLASELGVELHTEILKVCYDDVTSIMPSKWRDLHPQLVVHLGVSSEATGILLEKQAFNNPYCLKDVNNSIPFMNVCSPDGCQVLQTNLDLEKAINELRDYEFPNLNFSISEDPGRYLCGFVYYKSLSFDQHKSLFLHIPTTKTVSSDVSVALTSILEGVKAVIRVIYKQTKSGEVSLESTNQI